MHFFANSGQSSVGHEFSSSPWWARLSLLVDEGLEKAKNEHHGGAVSSLHCCDDQLVEFGYKPIRRMPVHSAPEKMKHVWRDARSSLMKTEETERREKTSSPLVFICGPCSAASIKRSSLC